MTPPYKIRSSGLLACIHSAVNEAACYVLCARCYECLVKVVIPGGDAAVSCIVAVTNLQTSPLQCRAVIHVLLR